MRATFSFPLRFGSRLDLETGTNVQERLNKFITWCSLKSNFIFVWKKIDVCLCNNTSLQQDPLSEVQEVEFIIDLLGKWKCQQELLFLQSTLNMYVPILRYLKATQERNCPKYLFIYILADLFQLFFVWGTLNSLKSPEPLSFGKPLKSDDSIKILFWVYFFRKKNLCLYWQFVSQS